MGNGHGTLSDEAVHSARKRLKKARSALRLLRESLGPRRYRRENIALRDAARPLTDVRDAKVLVVTVDKLAADASGALDASAIARLLQRLAERNREVRRRVLEENDSAASVRQSLEETLQRVEKSPGGRQGWSVLGAGLKRVYRNARKAFEAAKDQPSTENLHEWRKQTKYLRHEIEMIEPLWPTALAPLAEQLHNLADQLGDEHDLAVLRTTLHQQPPLLPNRAAADGLVKLIEHRRTELQEKALELGSQLYIDRPKRFTQRLHCQWKNWSAKDQ